MNKPLKPEIAHITKLLLCLTSPPDPLIGWFDYGSSITLADTETLTLDFDGAAGFLTEV